MRMNASMSRLLTAVPRNAPEEDAPEAYRAIAAEGWIVDDRGAQLLKALRSGYSGHGSDEEFLDVIHLEASVNARGMMDYDLPSSGPERVALLVRRCLGYAYAALRTVPSTCEWPMLSYVSMSHGGLEDETLTASVTFCSRRPDVAPYVGELDSYVSEALLEISQDEVPRSP